MRNLSKVNKELYHLIIRSVIAYLICIVVCGIHVRDIYSSYEKNLNEKQINDMDQAEQLTNAYFSDMDRFMALGAAEIAKAGGQNSSLYADVLARICNMGKFSQVIYVSDGVIYSRNGIEYGQEMMEGYRTMQESGLDRPHVILDVPRMNDQMIMFPRKVEADGETIGYLIGLYDCKDLFELPLYDTLRKSNQCYLIMEGGLILDEADHDSVTNKRLDSDNFFTQMYALTDGNNNSKKKIQSVKVSLEAQPDQDFSVKTTVNHSHTCLVSTRAIVPVEKIYLVCILDKTAYMKGMSPFIWRTVLLLAALLGITIFINLLISMYIRRVTRRIERMAYTDDVTKGKNVNYFKKEAMKLLELNQELPYIIQRFDISNFRYLNEAYGHTRADEILKSCIDIYSELYTNKELCVRMDSDQFLTLTVNDNDVEERRTRYCERLNEYAVSNGVTYPIQLKFGIYQIRKQDRDIDVMIDRANVAKRSLAVNKSESVALYTDSIIQDMRKVDKIESDMQHALDTGEFKVFLQAKWDIVDNHVAGAEALVRWIKPDGNMVYPDEFIPVFEQDGFIEKLDFYMLETVCKRMDRIIKEGGTVYPVSVNQSRVLLHNPDYVDKIRNIFGKYEIPRNCVELEVTETSLADNREHMIYVLKELKKEEVQLSMDDFGSGYSSLNLLKDMPFDVLKIDREFFSESITSESSMLILQKIIEMADGLGIEVICEGVENETQVELLKKIGCRRVQGYYYARPVPMEEYVSKYCQAAES